MGQAGGERQTMTSNEERTLTYKCVHCDGELNIQSCEVLDPKISRQEVEDYVPPIACQKCGRDDSLELEDFEADEDYDFTKEELAEEGRPSVSPTVDLQRTARGTYLGCIVKGKATGVVVGLAGGSVIFLNGNVETLKGMFGRRRLGSPVTVHDLGDPKKTSIEIGPDVLNSKAGENN